MKAFLGKTVIVSFLAMFSVAFLPCFAQQDIITVPNSETLPFGTIILKDSNTITPKDSVKVTPSVIMGLGHDFDLAVGVPLKIDTSNGNTGVKGEIGLKKVFFLGPSTRLTVGGEINPYLNSATTPDFLTYAHVTQKIKKTRTSITAGGYLSGDKKFFNTTGVMLGVEQVIIPNKLRIACDWWTGDNRRSNLSVGLKYRPKPTISINTAVIIPNRSGETIGFKVSVSKLLQFKKERGLL